MNADLGPRQQKAEIRRRLETAITPLPSPAERRRLREAWGGSEVALGAVIGASGTAVHRWEKGTRSPRGELRRRYAEALTLISESEDEA